MKVHIAKMKADLKLLATEIRTLKSKRKDPAHNGGCGYVRGLDDAQFNFRAKHIAYCMLRGRTLEQIEPKLRDPNSWTHTRVRKEAARLVAEVLNPKQAEVKDATQDLRTGGQAPVALATSGTVWTRITQFFS